MNRGRERPEEPRGRPKAIALLGILTILLALAIDGFLLARKRRTAAALEPLPVVAMKLPQPPQGVFLDTYTLRASAECRT